MRQKLLFSLLLSALLVGCAAPYNTNFPLVEKQMTSAKITELLGKPVSAQSGPGDSKILFYRLASSPLDTDGSDTREYWVQMQDGVVIGYGERNDTATFMRQAQQFESAWNAVRSTNELNKNLIDANRPPVNNGYRAPTTTNCTRVGNTTNCSSY